MNWIEYANHFQYPTVYRSRRQAFQAAQRLAQELSIFTETAEIEDDGRTAFVVITKNSVPSTRGRE